jgi:excisionase family DNA binding protein
MRQSRLQAIRARVVIMHAPESRMLRAEEVAERYGIKRNTVYEKARLGELPSVRIGRLVRFSPRQLEEFEARGGFSQMLSAK